ncbi:hypothetical protein ACNPQM_30325 [Streptomyces sp. NPDC056231]|uniref:hypothetical protein n=1 Tax=Streptomyces sp. NPDC056231 TaxID=3345755 RepID=UPI003AABD145
MLLTDPMFPEPCSLSAISCHPSVTCANHSAAAARSCTAPTSTAAFRAARRFPRVPRVSGPDLLLALRAEPTVADRAAARSCQAALNASSDLIDDVGIPEAPTPRSVAAYAAGGALLVVRGARPEPV